MFPDLPAPDPMENADGAADFAAEMDFPPLGDDLPAGDSDDGGFAAAPLDFDFDTDT